MPLPSAIPPLLAAHDLTVTTPDGTPLLQRISLSLGAERVGLIGPNGAGKSTLLRVLAHRERPARGEVVSRGRVALLEQHRPSAPGGTVAELLGVADVLQALERCDRGECTAQDLTCIGDRWQLRQQLDELLASLAFAPAVLQREQTSLSGGERSRLRLAAQLLTAPDVLLLDEPTNDLDSQGRGALYDLLAQWRGGVLVASHDRDLLHRMDRLLIIERTQLRAFGGGYAAWAEAEEADAQRRRSHANQAKAELARVTRHAQVVRERQARRDAHGVRERDTGSQSKLLLNAQRERSEGTSARLRDTTARLQQEAREGWRQARAALDERDPIQIVMPAGRIAEGSCVVQCTDVAIDAAPGVPLLRQVTFAVRGAARVAFRGPNGVGKSTLLRMLVGEHPVVAGTVYRGVPRADWAWLDQHTWLLNPEHTVLEAHAAAQQWTGEHAKGQARALLAHFGFRGDLVGRRIDTLSGGERVRAALACALGTLSGDDAPRCLVLDEPTNHLDLESLAALEQALTSWRGALLVVSHDARFLAALGVSTTYEVADWRPERRDR
ncbi:ABC-F family ATP-binding cassette domain-containing protein [Gemmatimonas phototrophica]|uniref:ABC transporter domain-containing protein n=1 Tax=Gemmatimonas phototrophica TaxID=1379270 RepID=A0A143BNY2_9BACT|nr:ABC-F family ATP-binding cassette domain-containing protein [Gemmatimonas phototrophica]AMW06220.1 hypothetical protein GEMMAAP_18385 [Gemmatimonas phototrophica]